MNENRFKELPPGELRVKIDPDLLGFESTADCEYHGRIIGQDRAIKALTMGLEIESPGYNIYAAGLSGTGKASTIKNLLEQLDLKKKIPDDICYVNNFRDTDMPVVFMLPAGLGKQLRGDMDDMILYLQKQIPHLFESEIFKKKSEHIVNSYMDKQKEIVKTFSEKIEKENFQLVQFQIGPYTKQDVVPVYEGKPVPIEQLESLVEQDKFDRKKFDRIGEKLSELRIELDSTMKETRKIEKKIREEIDSLEHKTGLPVVSEHISDISLKYGKYSDKIKDYLKDVQENILSNLKLFQEKDEEKQPSPLPFLQTGTTEEKFTEYKVNVLIDNSQTKATPVIIENTPTYKNLFGTIEREVDRSGFWKTDFTKIKPGSLLRANGGYIVFNAIETLAEYGVWKFLKRTLENRLLTMQLYDPLNIASTAIKPEPIPIDVKVVMLGDDYVYHQLYNLEDSFSKIFKIKAPFDTEMPNNEKHISDYACFIKKIAEDEGLLQFHKSAVAEMVEFGIRLTGKQKKLSTRFSEIADLIREASYWARKDGSTVVMEAHVDKAWKEKIERVKLIEDKIQEMIEEGTIMIGTEGEVTGQVNGLSVYDLGDYTFGKPSRITAETSMGRAGVINIEREAKLSGKTHDKGVLILEGFFRGKYTQDKPLTMSVSICFEQSYGGVEGDSASSSEVCAILSSLSGLPVRQCLAMTGSVNQKGEVQPVGGINQKVEGFYDVCRAMGNKLTGTQGVIIPALNISSLMLRKDVVQAVSEGKFHIYPVSTIDECIAILTGVDAGERDEEGNYPPGTTNFLVNEKLEFLAKGLKDFGEKKSETQELPENNTEKERMLL
ncbi:MAG: ATP-binding protein [Thermodesulfobacteriota bacterium]|nr:ATP-binding protein [Thermodesulfobacteriota bacterium]